MLKVKPGRGGRKDFVRSFTHEFRYRWKDHFLFDVCVLTPFRIGQVGLAAAFLEPSDGLQIVLFLPGARPNFKQSST